MRRRLCEGVLEDLESLRSINADVASIGGKFLPYVRVERKDGSEIHVHASNEAMDAEAEAWRKAKAKAEEMITAATAPASGS